MSFETVKIENDIARLEAQLESEKRKVYGKGNPGDQMRQYKTGSSQYQEAKKKFDAIYLEYEAKQKEITNQINALELQKQKVVKKEEQKKIASKKEDNLVKAKDEYQRALDSKNTQRITDAKKNLDALEVPSAETNADGSLAGEAGDLSTDKYSEYTLNGDGTVTGSGGKSGIFVDAPDAKGNIVPTFYTSKASARDAFLKQYQGEGGVEGLKKQLLASKWISSKQLNDGTWVQGLDDMLVAYSYKSVSDMKYSGSKQPVGYKTFLAQQKGTGTGGSKTYRVITTRGEAKKLLDGYMTDLVGRPATAEEESAFYDQLHAAENKATRTITGTTQIGEVLGDADRLMIAAKVARKTLRGSNVDDLLKSNVGSTVATDIASMQKYAAEYGIEMTPAEALQRIASGIGQKDYVAKQEERLRQLAMTVHPYLKDHIAAGGTVKDVADVYAYTKSGKLGVAVPTSTKDKDIMSAIATGKTVTDFERELQSNPLWRKTDEARKMASDFTSTMLKTFGLG